MDRLCKFCNVTKPVEAFIHANSRRQGISYQCVECKRASDRRWRQRNAEKVRADKSAYGKANRAKHREWERAYRMRDPEHVRAVKRDWHQQHPDHQRLKFLRMRYGLTPEMYQAMWEAQQGRCALCDCELIMGRIGRNIVHVDHDHVTGKVRGLLCRVCNVVLGATGDSPAMLRKMADYLERPR